MNNLEQFIERFPSLEEMFYELDITPEEVLEHLYRHGLIDIPDEYIYPSFESQETRMAKPLETTDE